MGEQQSFRISPDDPAHDRLERDVARFIEGLGGETFKAPYHDVYPERAVRRLQKDFSWTGLYLRGRADRVAIFPNALCFQWEAKTHKSQKYRDITLEALPLAHHVLDSQLGVKCLYCHRDPHDDIPNKGIWVNDIPDIRDIHIPQSLGGGHLAISEEGRTEITRMLRLIWPDTPVYYPNRTRGSGDSYVIIEERHKNKMVSWEELIKEHLDATRS